MKIAEFLSKKWTLGPYDFAISHVFGFGFGFFLLDDRAYGTLGKEVAVIAILPLII